MSARPSSPSRARLSELRATIHRIERGGASFGKKAVHIGIPDIDVRLPGGGLAHAALHEIGGSAAFGFIAAIAGRALADPGMLVWCERDAAIHQHGALYGPGLAAFGISPERCLLVRCPDTKSLLWSLEEAARSPAVVCAVGGIGQIDLLASRRLQLAAEESGAVVLLRRDGPCDPQPLAALTRWRAEPTLPAIASPWQHRWRLDLWRSKGGAPGHWNVIWQKGGHHALSLDPAHGFRLAADAAGNPSPGRALAS